MNNIELISWNPYANWTFDSKHEDCPICKLKLVELCSNCICKANIDIKCCDVTKGKCGHCFHNHCIDIWLLKSKICPICRLPYDIKIKNMNNTDLVNFNIIS